MDNSAPPVEIVPISQLFCSPSNPRLNDAVVPHVAASIRRFGWQQPIVARLTGEVIAGNTRLKAAQSLGMTEVPLWWFGGTDLDAVVGQGSTTIAAERTGRRCRAIEISGRTSTWRFEDGRRRAGGDAGLDRPDV